MHNVRKSAIAAAMLVAAVLMSLLQGAGAAASANSPAPAANGEDPVIMVHGLYGAEWNWDTIKRKLKNAGYADDQLHTFGYNTITQSNVKTAALLADKVDEVLAKTGADQVDIVGHSMGSLNSRYCIKYDDCGGKVDDWVSLAGPNNGTANWWVCWWQIACQEMAPNSAFIGKLNSGATLPSDVEGTVIWSPDDGVVTPASSSVLDGVENIKIDGVDHIGMLTDDKVFAKLLTAISN